MPAVPAQLRESVIAAFGDAMSPIIRSGDRVIIESVGTVRHGDIVAVSMDGWILLRRYFSSGSLVSLLPENSDYEAIAWEQDAAFRLLGRVTHVIHALSPSALKFELRPQMNAIARPLFSGKTGQNTDNVDGIGFRKESPPHTQRIESPLQPAWGKGPWAIA